ncbi:unnamed protein product [marine sediment metagenome]|uniref:Zona occludens toxin N-terminal domain-containing protein n=1 Tax=marine sediment metagenome TaxID=412755 RepID=X1AS81_9ZZZZ
MKALDKKYTWVELCDRVIRHLGVKKSERVLFTKWFMKREGIGYLFDPFLIWRCFFIWKELKKGLDHFIILSGKEGYGKSTLAFQIASWIDPSFNVSMICYDAKSFVNIMLERANSNKLSPEGLKALVLDEGTELLSRDHQNVTNKVLIKTFFIQRALKFLVLINCPNFHLIDSVVRFHRCRTLIEVTQRAHYKGITGKAIKIISDVGMKTKSISGVKLPIGTFWHGTFKKDFPKTIIRSDYELHKHDGIRRTLKQLQGELGRKIP